MKKKSKIFPSLSPFNLRGCLAAFIFFEGISALLYAYEIKNDKEVSSRKPVLVTAYQLTFDRPRGLSLFTGNVKAIHDKVVLLADEISALEGNREATAEGHVHVVDNGQGITLTCGNLEYEDMMDLMTAHDHPLLTTLDENGSPITVLGRQMEVDSAEKTVVVNQNVQIFHKEGRAESQKATFLSAEDKFILEDDPKVYTDNGLLSGRRIVSNLGQDRSLLVEGMADAIFNPNGKPVTNQLAAKHTDTNAPAGTSTPAGASTPTSSSAPVTSSSSSDNNATTQPSGGLGNNTSGVPGQSGRFRW